MGFESKLFSGIMKSHNEVHNKPFIAQYGRGEVTLNAHYQHLSQLLAIYAVIENFITNQKVDFIVPLELQELTERTELLSDDLNYLRPYVSDTVRLAPLANMTILYIEHLKKLNLESEEGSDILLAHFLVRILGDLSGGQSFKLYLKNLYDEQGLDSTKGTKFYEFSEDMHKKCNKWLNSLPSGEQKLYEDESRMKLITAAANESISFHMKIFDEIQGDRVPLTYGRFFVGTAVVTATVAIVGFGLALSY